MNELAFKLLLKGRTSFHTITQYLEKNIFSSCPHGKIDIISSSTILQCKRLAGDIHFPFENHPQVSLDRHLSVATESFCEVHRFILFQR